MCIRDSVIPKRMQILSEGKGKRAHREEEEKPGIIV